MNLLWLTDLHLDSATPRTRQDFYRSLRETAFDAAVITGDISTSRLLSKHLAELAQACSPRNVYFVLGNHDFYGASFDKVDRIATSCCRQYSNLHHLGQGEIVRLGPDSALIGHRGWADGRAYGGKRTARRFPDQNGIEDLRYRSTYPAFQKMERLGKESAAYFRKLLPYTAAKNRRVLIATHVPPFARAVHFDDRPCEAARLPHFVNASAGALIKRIGSYFPGTQISVLCGHSHSNRSVRIANNIEVRVGSARRGTPHIQEVFSM